MQVVSYKEDDFRRLIVTNPNVNWVVANGVAGCPAEEIDQPFLLEQLHQANTFGGGNHPKFARYCLIRETNPEEQKTIILCDDVNELLYGYTSIQNPPVPEPEPENEIPSHILDHNYAKKPREPGTEPVKAVRRRSRKKEMVTNQYVIQEMVQHEGPRINIIRQPLPGASGYKPVGRPKIIKTTNPLCLKSAAEPRLKRKQQSIKTEPETVKEEPEEAGPIYFDECDVPQLGALVTISDTNHSSPALKSHRSGSSEYSRRSYPKCPASTYIELPVSISSEAGDLDHMGDGEEAEFFFDFPIDDETENLEDLDFCGMSLSHGMSNPAYDDSSGHLPPSAHAGIPEDSIPREDSTYRDDLGIDESNYVLKSESDLYVKLANLRESLDGAIHIPQHTESDDRPKKMKMVNTTELSKILSGAAVTVTHGSPIRRSSRPSRTPSRLDNDDIILSPNKRTYKSRLV